MTHTVDIDGAILAVMDELCAAGFDESISATVASNVRTRILANLIPATTADVTGFLEDNKPWRGTKTFEPKPHPPDIEMAELIEAPANEDRRAIKIPGFPAITDDRYDEL